MKAAVRSPLQRSSSARASRTNTARYHASRLLIELDRNPEARKSLDDVTPRLSTLNRSSINEFLALKMEVADSLAGFLAKAVRTQMSTNDGLEVEELAPDAKPLRLFDGDGAIVFNAVLPLDLWLQALKQTQLPSALRRQLALAGFARAFILKHPAAIDFARFAAQMRPADASDMNKYIAATQPDDRFR